MRRGRRVLLDKGTMEVIGEGFKGCVVVRKLDGKFNSLWKGAIIFFNFYPSLINFD